MSFLHQEINANGYAKNLVTLLSKASPFQSRCSRTCAANNKTALAVPKITMHYKITSTVL